MAIKDKNRASQRGKSEEMTVVILKFKGSGDTLQKGFDAVNQAIRTLGGPVPTRYLPQQQPPMRELATGKNNDPESAVLEGDDELDADEGDHHDAQSARSNGGSRRSRTPKYEDLDWNGNGTPWKDYFAAKGPATIDDKYLVAAAWLTQHGGLPTFKVPHIFSCFRAAGWEEQQDFTQPMRKLKSKKSYFENPQPRTWKLTGLGLGAANAVAPQAG